MQMIIGILGALALAAFLGVAALALWVRATRSERTGSRLWYASLGTVSGFGAIVVLVFTFGGHWSDVGLAAALVAGVFAVGRALVVVFDH